jgi:hypothetical protein
MALLNRMVLVTEESFETFLPAAELLQRYGRTADARDFLERRLRAVPWDAHARTELALLQSGPPRDRLLSPVITDSQAEYQERARAAGIYRGQPIAAVANTELAVLSSSTVDPAAASKPYFVEARLAASAANSDQDTRYRLFREALAVAPEDVRVRVGAIELALTLRRDSMALAMAQSLPLAQGQPFQANIPQYFPPGRFFGRFNGGFAHLPAILVAPPQLLPEAQRAALAESLAAAAERLDDLPTAEDYLRTAINLLPSGERASRETKLQSLAREQSRRAQNASRQPIIQNMAEQHQVVRPRIVRSAQ